MMSARNVIAAAIGLVVGASFLHCSAAGNASKESPDPRTLADDGGGDAVSGNHAFPGTPDNSKGVILVHASPNLPAFRLCFGKLSGGSLVSTPVSSALRPLPDRALMPDSNVVGVEIGSAVRLSPLGQADVGVLSDDRVFAIPEADVRPGGGADLPCSQRICPTSFSSTCLAKDPPVVGQRGYYDLGQLPPRAVQDNIQLLVLHGCVPGAADAGLASCGAGYNPTTGNMKLSVLPLTAYTTLTHSQFFVQVAQLSDVAVGTALSVRYGELGNAASMQDIALSGNFGQIAPSGFPENFTLDRSASGIYASRGFRISVGSQIFTKSLAEIQLVTAPQALPEALYASTSNFVVLLLGDPSLSNLEGSALSSMTEPGLLLHLLVVPVGQPVDRDGGVRDAGGG